MFDKLQEINSRPLPFEFYTASDLWTDEHTSEQMLKYHLMEDVDLSSRNRAFIDKSVQWIVSRFDIKADTRVIDFGCGPGLYTTRLASHGAKVTGVDFSARSIEYAQNTAAEQKLEITYFNEDYLEFEADGQFDLAIMIMCDFCVLSPQQRNHMLIKFKNILKPGGAVLLDVYSLAAFDQIEQAACYEENLLDGFWSAQKYYGFMNKFKYEQEKVGLDKYTIVEASRTRRVYNWLQYFSPDSLRLEFEAAGLGVNEIIGNVAGEPYDSTLTEFAVIARKD